MKEKQRALIIEIMKADEESGLYTTRKQTAVEWYFTELWNAPKDKFVWQHYLNKAKQMEKEQIKEAYMDGFDRYKSHPYLAERYYKETYE